MTAMLLVGAFLAWIGLEIWHALPKPEPVHIESRHWHSKLKRLQWRRQNIVTWMRRAKLERRLT